MMGRRVDASARAEVMGRELKGMGFPPDSGQVRPGQSGSEIKSRNRKFSYVDCSQQLYMFKKPMFIHVT